MSTESLPRRIGKYELRQKLGQGGMGTVYRALEIGLHRSVAVKLMKSEYRDNANIRQRFFQEARAVAALDHPHIIKIFYFDDEPELYLVMEFVPSGSLRGYLRHHQEDGTVLEVREALRLTRHIADALQVAHNQHMIHRDVKPDNVLLKPLTIRRQTTFHPLLTDFGLVKLAEDVGFQTQPGTAIGTYAYMSPEQLKGSEVDHRTDVYALGIMLYELVVGKLPFYPKTPTQAYDMHHFQEPPLPSDLRPGITPSLENLILRAIAKNPNDRFQTALDLSEALMDIESGDADRLTQLDSMASHGGQLESLSQYMTALPGTPVDDELSRLDTPDALPNDRVAIQKVGEAPIYIQMTRPTFIIGRTDDADITLPSTQVSRQHARINRRRDGVYTITDLGSTNRTFIDGVEILSDVPEPWGASQLVTIGEYRLTLQLAAGAQDTHPEMVKPSMEGLAFPSGDTAPSRAGGHLHTAAESDPVTVQLSPARANVQAGSQTTVNLAIQSMTTTVEHFRIQVQGLPNDWVSVPPTALQLMPGSSGSIPITFRPPLTSTSTAGDHQYSVRVASEERGMEIARIDGLLSLPAFHRFSTDMTPQRVTPGQTINLTLENNGNSTEHITINARDRAAAVKFDPASASITINPGQQEVVRIRPRPLKVKWLGTLEMFPLEVRAMSMSGQEQIQAGELVVKPRLPTWAAGLLSLLCAGLVMMGAYVGFIRDDDEPTSTPDRQSEVDHTVTDEPSETPEISPALMTATAIIAEATQTAAAHEEGSGRFSLTVAIVGSDNESSAFQAATREMGLEFGIEFDIVVVDRDTMTALMAGDNPPDFIVASDELIREYATSGILETIHLGSAEADFTAASLSTLRLDGNLYGVPYSAHTLALVCSIPWMEEYGYETDVGLLEIYEAQIPFAMVIDTYHFAPILHAFDGYFFGMTRNGDYNTSDIGIAHGEGFEAFSWLQDMATSGALIDVNLDNQGVVEHFIRFAVGCIITGSWNVEQFDAIGMDYQVMPIRAVRDADSGATWLSVMGIAVPSASQNRDVALEVMQAIFATAPFQAQMVEALPHPSVYHEFLTPEQFTGLNGFALVAENGLRLPAVEMTNVWGPMQSILEGIVRGEIGIEEALQEMQAFFEEISFP